MQIIQDLVQTMIMKLIFQFLRIHFPILSQQQTPFFIDQLQKQILIINISQD